jgi:hypothetical protein
MSIFNRISGFSSAVLTASLALLPFTANAQYSGTNGQVFFLYTNASVNSIAAMNADGTQSHIIISNTATDIYSYLAASPDGSKILYSDQYTATSGGTAVSRLYIASPTNSNPVLLYTSTASIELTGATFDGTGSTVAFALRDYSGSSISASGIYTVPATGGTATQIVTVTPSEGDIKGIAFSAANSLLYYGLLQGGSGGSNNLTPSSAFKSAAITGANQTVIKSFSDSNQIFSDISPDGTKILYTSRDTSSIDQIFSLSAANGSGITQITHASDTGTIDVASYSPDGTKIVYSSFQFTSTGETLNGARVISADGATSFGTLRRDAQFAVLSTVANSAAGTYPTELAGGTTNYSVGLGGTGSTTTTSVTLPKTGSPLKQSLPYLLLGLGLAGVATIEVVGRARNAKR